MEVNFKHWGEGVVVKKENIWEEITPTLAHARNPRLIGDRAGFSYHFAKNSGRKKNSGFGHFWQKSDQFFKNSGQFQPKKLQFTK